MGKKKKPTTRQVGVRLPDWMIERLGAVADGLAMDTSNLIRLILAEKLPEYETRAEQARAKPPAH